MVINTLQYDTRYTQRHINTLLYDARHTQHHINTLLYDARYIQRHINSGILSAKAFRGKHFLIKKRKIRTLLTNLFTFIIMGTRKNENGVNNCFR